MSEKEARWFSLLAIIVISIYGVLLPPLNWFAFFWIVFFAVWIVIPSEKS